MWTKTTLAAGLLLLAGSLVAAKHAPAPAPPVPGPDPDCRTCSDHAEAVGPLSKQDFEALLDAYAAEPVGAQSRALDTLLFHGTRAQELLKGTRRLGARWRHHLERELARDHASLVVSVIDEDGVERIRLDRRVPLGIKQHLHGATNGLSSPEISGTVRRVGVDYLWGRL